MIVALLYTLTLVCKQTTFLLNNKEKKHFAPKKAFPKVHRLNKNVLSNYPLRRTVKNDYFNA